MESAWTELPSPTSCLVFYGSVLPFVGFFQSVVSASPDVYTEAEISQGLPAFRAADPTVDVLWQETKSNEVELATHNM